MSCDAVQEALVTIVGSGESLIAGSFSSSPQAEEIFSQDHTASLSAPPQRTLIIHCILVLQKEP